MADNVQITAGAGTVIATDEVSRNGITEQEQIVKLSLGAEGVHDLLLDSGQQAMAASLPVAIASNQSAIPVTDNSTTFSVDDDGGSLTVDNDGTFATQSTLQASEYHIGEVGGKTLITALTFSLDTNIYADGDVLADSQSLAACLRVNDGTGILQDAVFLDIDDQGQAFDVIILDANKSLGTENLAVSISDADAAYIIGRFSVGVGDWYDLGGSRIANIKNIGIAVKAVSGGANLYVGLVSRGTGTYSASGIIGRFKILCD